MKKLGRTKKIKSLKQTTWLKADIENRMPAHEALLAVNDLTIGFPPTPSRDQHTSWERENFVPVIQSLHARVRPGEVVAIVGASGSGKSLLVDALLGVSQDAAFVGGDIRYRSHKLEAGDLAELAGNAIAVIPQSVNSLDPLMRVGKQILAVYQGRVCRWGRKARSEKIALNQALAPSEGKPAAPSLALWREKMNELFARYELPAHTENCYPFELSGGMARRVLIVSALMSQCDVIVADEPTVGLHAGLAQRLMQDLQACADQGRGVLLITHDLELALRYATKISFFYAGSSLEVASTAELCAGEAYHPFTRALINALPQRGFKAIPGNQPLPGISAGCPFETRCLWALDVCQLNKPPEVRTKAGMVRCHNPAAYCETSRAIQGRETPAEEEAK